MKLPAPKSEVFQEVWRKARADARMVEALKRQVAQMAQRIDKYKNRIAELEGQRRAQMEAQATIARRKEWDAIQGVK